MEGELVLIYKINKDQKENNESKNELKLFGESFVDNYKDKCKLIFEDEIYDLISTFDLNNIEINDNDEIIFKLTDIDELTNISYMFQNCENLFSLPNIGEWDISNITDIEGIFLWLFIINIYR